MSGGYSGWASWAIGEQIVQEAVAIVVAANGGGSDGGQVGRIDGDLEVAYRGGAMGTFPTRMRGRLGRSRGATVGDAGVEGLGVGDALFLLAGCGRG